MAVWYSGYHASCKIGFVDREPYTDTNKTASTRCSAGPHRCNAYKKARSMHCIDGHCSVDAVLLVSVYGSRSTNPILQEA